MPKKKIVKKASRYFEAIGRRKTAVARVRLQDKSPKEFLINNQPLEKYFSLAELQQTAKDALLKTACFDKFAVSVKAMGGGLSAQAEAVRHGLARALVKFDSVHRKTLQKAGWLTRDSRMRERKKFGLKRARRAPQWKKR